MKRAELRENLTATWGYLQIENVSGQTIENAIFYGEYFDGAGRFCFSLVFSLRRNVGGLGPIAPGETRELYSLAAGLSPASNPVDLELHIVRQSPASIENQSEIWNGSIRAPLTGGGSIPASADELQLGSEVELAKGPILDLVLAKVTVDTAGSLESVDVLNAVDDEVATWFLKFVRYLTFHPATEGGAPVTGEGLVLVQAVVSTENLAKAPILPQNSPWVRAYAERLTPSSAVSPVTEILFEPPPAKVKLGGQMAWTNLPPAAPGLFEVLLLGSDWCPGIFRWVTDPDAPHGRRRELVP